MAIKKSEAGKLTAKEEAALGVAENLVDATIQLSYKEGQHIYVDLRQLGPLSPRARDVLCLRFKAAGWSVVLKPDQRWGDYLEFS